MQHAASGVHDLPDWAKDEVGNILFIEACALGLQLDVNDRALFEFFRRTVPRFTFGSLFTLPENLQFFLDSPLSNVLIIRECYARIMSIINKSINSSSKGVLFTGAQGNSKTWCSIYIVWNLLFMKMTVIYEVSETKSVYVIRSDGAMRILHGTAASSVIPEMSVFGSGRAVHTEQRNILRYVIPSYTLQELSLYSGYFGVEAKANSISADQLEHYIDNNFFQCADSGDISAGLMKVTVREEEYEDPDDAYLDRHAIWEIASQHLCKIILSNAKTLKNRR
eukprot:gene23784-32171_t